MWTLSQGNLILLHVNYKGTDQPAHWPILFILIPYVQVNNFIVMTGRVFLG